MNNVFLRYEMSVENILEMLAPRVDDNQLRLVSNAYGLAAEAHKKQKLKRKTCEPYIIHPMAVAHIAEPNRPFCAAIWPVSAANTARFRIRNETFCNSLTAWRLARMAIMGVLYIKV